MADENNIGEIMIHLQNISQKLSEDDTFKETFHNFRNEYSERNQDVREALRDIKDDFKYQKEDMTELHTDVQLVKDKLNRLEIQLEPVLEFKKMIQQQVMKYSSIGLLVLMSLTMGLNIAPV
tara:strand:- start:49314 stop:49679 length:366 start_codon:yes stop_codon:yes gene_type:complete